MSLERPKFTRELFKKPNSTILSGPTGSKDQSHDAALDHSRMAPSRIFIVFHENDLTLGYKDLLKIQYQRVDVPVLKIFGRQYKACRLVKYQRFVSVHSTCQSVLSIILIHNEPLPCAGSA